MKNRYSIYLDLPGGSVFVLSRTGHAFATRRAAIAAGDRERLRHKCAAWLVTIQGDAIAKVTAL